MISERPAAGDDIDGLEILDWNYEVRYPDEREPHLLFARFERDSRLRADFTHREKVDLRRLAQESGCQHPGVRLDRELMPRDNPQLQGESGRAEGGIAAQVGARAIGVEIDETHVGSVRSLQEAYAVRAYPRASTADSTYYLG